MAVLSFGEVRLEVYTVPDQAMDAWREKAYARVAAIGEAVAGMQPERSDAA